MSVQPMLEKPVRNIDAHELRNYLNEFILQNGSSRDVEHRWLAAYAADLMAQAYNVKAGNHDTIRKQVEEFRLREIETKKAELRKQMELLDNEEASTLRAIEKVSTEST